MPPMNANTAVPVWPAIASEIALPRPEQSATIPTTVAAWLVAFRSASTSSKRFESNRAARIIRSKSIQRPLHQGIESWPA
jgi:hypothetical protein